MHGLFKKKNSIFKANPQKSEETLNFCTFVSTPLLFFLQILKRTPERMKDKLENK
jgi:hypothetical protein